jgi:threonine synthase
MDKYGYLADTHTAVAISAAEQYIEKTGDKKPMIVASTASPYKFANDVYVSLYGEHPTDPVAALDQLSARSNTEIPYPLRGIGERTVRFTDVVPSDKMWDAVVNYVNK